MPQGNCWKFEKSIQPVWKLLPDWCDEFCVLLRQPEKEEFCREKFFWIMEKRRKVVTILPGVSYGSAELQENESICDTKVRADQHMYDNKKEHKEQRKTS